jgi:subtilisin family serine protease
MKKRDRTLILLFGTIFLIGIIGASHIQENINSDEKISSELLNSFNNNEEVAVFIQFEPRQSDVPKIISFFKTDEKQDILEEIGSDKVEYDFGNLVSASINQKDLDLLSRSEVVESVKPMGFKQIFLQDSVPLINSSSSWNLKESSINLTGLGQTVCIIDTGVNYTHADLGNGYGNNTDFSYKIIGGVDYCPNDVNCSIGGEDYDPMDVNGHGTHVAGIVAANGSIRGVAPGVKIIMIKAANSSGTFWDSDIIAGINWCVNNASTFNISVISMSLGGGSYANYCDAEEYEAAYVAPINAAIAKNISVVIAAGNSNNWTHIASPACIQNATPITSSTKLDVLSNYNRNFLVRLVAPGTSINSTYLVSKGGLYVVASGTSMATPHVAGAIAILNQYLNLTSRTKTPSEIEDILSLNGKNITDSQNISQNFSRINIYDAIISLDEDAPSVSLVSPANGSLFVSNQNFTCNATDLSLKNVTFYLWNSTGVYNQTSSSVSGGLGVFQVNLTNISLGTYIWNCEYYDESSNRAFAINNTIIPLLVTLNSPVNNNSTNINETNFNCSFASSESYTLKNSTFYLWNSTGNLIYNETKNISGISNKSIFNYNFTIEQEYRWNCLGTINSSDSGFASSNFSITYDVTKPIITINSPATSLTSTSVTLNVTLNEQGSCSYSHNSGANTSMSSSNNLTFTASVTGTEGANNVAFYCNDSLGNLNSSSRNFTIDTSCSGCACTNSCGGSGGGGGGATVVSAVALTSLEFASGVNKEILTSQQITFTSSGSGHTLKINRINNDSVNLTLQSSPINVLLYVGQETKQDLNTDGIFDIYVKLNSILNNRANLTIKSINEPISQVNSGTNLDNSTGADEQNSTLDKIFNPKNFWQKLYIPGILLIIIILIVLYYLESRKLHKKYGRHALELKNVLQEFKR